MNTEQNITNFIQNNFDGWSYLKINSLDAMNVVHDLFFRTGLYDDKNYYDNNEVMHYYAVYNLRFMKDVNKSLTYYLYSVNAIKKDSNRNFSEYTCYQLNDLLNKEKFTIDQCTQIINCITNLKISNNYIEKMIKLMESKMIEMKEYELSMKCAEKLKNKSYTKEQMYEKYASLYLNDGNFTKAIQYYQMANNHKEIGHIYEKQNNDDEAIKHYLLALNKYPECHCKLGTLYSKQNNNNEAEKHFLLGKTYNANNPDYYNNMGNFYESNKKYDEAVKYYNLAIQHNNFTCIEKLVQVYLMLNRDNDAMNLYLKFPNHFK